MFARRLAELRNRRHLTQYELADRLQFSRAQIGNYEQGTREPDFQTLITFADFFDVSVDYLLGRTDDPIASLGGMASDVGDIVIFSGQKEQLTSKEAEFLQESLAMFRRLETKWGSERRS
ncbi:helix-turn-helix domain-containing protein [Paenibacillus sp. MSJ-34]|uniref:helix-turn-helix domain-containing protein n=1 Tax=Paenibacillus sp. MSJ-34 TaxID=2841529 RepID=UPI001C0F4916|nr:helix-turn-helix transcriptional regulator [Paenibacillus sp. MSJ-34]MBU5445416.1 helix-turn-helix domain-containing protein [Paenibacillus sp. MSJ-34]